MYYRRFEQLCKRDGVTPSQVSKSTGISTATLSSWKNGKYTPKTDKLQKIADYFGVTLEYLMSGTSDVNKDIEGKKPFYYVDEQAARLAQEIFDDPDMRTLYHMKRNMDPETFKAHIDMMKRMYRLENPEDNNSDI